MKARVPKYGAPQQFVTVDTEATKGATIGVNVYDADGNLWREPAPAAASTGYPVTVWDKLQSVPLNVRAVAALATDGIVRKAGDTWSAAPLAYADLPATGAAEGNALVFTAGAWAPGTAAGEILIQNGSSAPPVMLTNEAEDDFLYAG